MQKETARKFWQRHLNLVRRGMADTYTANPAAAFAVSVKAGEHDRTPSDQYQAALHDHEQLCTIWRDQAKCTAGAVLLNALEMTSISDTRCRAIVDILADCSAESDYAPEQLKPAASGRRTNQYEAQPASGVDRAAEPPKEIYDDLCRHVRGQDAAKRTAATIIYNQLKGRRTNAVFCGPSGCGKTEIWRVLSRKYPGLVRIVDASCLSADGWKGSLHLRDIFEGIPMDDSGLVVVLDEADKICCEAAVGSGGTNYNAIVQNNLLKMLDGDVIDFGQEDGNRKPFSVDCSRVSVVLLGAFERLMEGKSRRSGGIGFGSPIRRQCGYGNTEITHADLIAAGMRREFAGRLNRIVALRPLSLEDYRAILLGPVLDGLQASRQCSIRINTQYAASLARQAMETGLGVRWMKSQIINALDELMFDDPTAEEYIIADVPIRWGEYDPGEGFQCQAS